LLWKLLINSKLIDVPSPVINFSPFCDRPLRTYLTCLEGSAKGDEGCPLAAADAQVIQADFTGDSCTFTDTCICQKDFWTTNQSAAQEADTCSAIQTYITCLKGKTALACDNTTSAADLATGVETRMKALDTPVCTVTTACQCEIDAAKADISTDDKKCTAYKAEYACLYPLTTDPCVNGIAIADLKTTVGTSVTSTASCTFDDTCVCQRTYDDAARGTNQEKCAAYKTQLSCLRTAKSFGCDGTTTKSAIATAAENERAALPDSDCPAPSATCQCEVNAAKGDSSTNNKYCTVLTDLKTCLNEITTTTEVGCSNLTQTDLVKDTDTKITAAKCGSFADHVTYTMASLIVPVLIHLFIALQTYLTCLETSGKADTGCPLETADAATIETDYTDDTCSTSFTDTCICLKDFWKTDQSGALETDTCSATQTYITCLKGKTALACDGTTSAAALASAVETRMKALDNPSCNVTTACQCEIDAAKANISTDALKCTAYKAQYACLYSLTTAPCDSAITVDALKTAAAASVTSTTSCTFDDTCVCQNTYDAATKRTASDQCTAFNTELSCLRTAKSAGCDGTSTKSSIATAAETARNALTTTDCPAASSTCLCEITAAKGDTSTDANYCNVLTTLRTCLSAITTTTEAGCTTLTQADLLNDTNTKITAATCGGEHVTFAVMSLIVSVVASMFL
ncbi:mucin-22-like, partial [Haliotis asinina]|uniref:mucin-22-like n=1 Tax=Haliotis asinina TaxID=109174 RepID=UPI003531968C